MFRFGRYKKQENPYHPDILIWLIGIPFISAFNYYLTYSNISWGWFLALTYSIDTTQGFLSIFIVRAHILYLDEVLPYEKGIFKRVLIQFLSVSMMGLLIISLTTEMVSLIAKGTFAPFSFYAFDLFIISIWFFVVNGVYVMLFFIKKWRHYQEQFKPDQQGFLLKTGSKNSFLNYAEVAVVQASQDYALIHSIKGEKYYHSESLNAMEATLPFHNFFRLNRQYIISRRIIAGYDRIENGKLKARLLDPFRETSPVISRDKAPAFKRWLES